MVIFLYFFFIFLYSFFSGVWKRRKIIYFSQIFFVHSSNFLRERVWNSFFFDFLVFFLFSSMREIFSSKEWVKSGEFSSTVKMKEKKEKKNSSRKTVRNRKTISCGLVSQLIAAAHINNDTLMKINKKKKRNEKRVKKNRGKYHFHRLNLVCAPTVSLWKINSHEKKSQGSPCVSRKRERKKMGNFTRDCQCQAVCFWGCHEEKFRSIETHRKTEKLFLLDSSPLSRWELHFRSSWSLVKTHTRAAAAKFFAGKSLPSTHSAHNVNILIFFLSLTRFENEANNHKVNIHVERECERV